MELVEVDMAASTLRERSAQHKRTLLAEEGCLSGERRRGETETSKRDTHRLKIGHRAASCWCDASRRVVSARCGAGRGNVRGQAQPRAAERAAPSCENRCRQRRGFVAGLTSRRDPMALNGQPPPDAFFATAWKAIVPEVRPPRREGLGRVGAGVPANQRLPARSILDPRLSAAG